MLILTNRNIIRKNFKNGVGNEGAFGDEVNSKGPNEIRLAHAEKVNGNWEVKLVKEPSILTEKNIPSKKVFGLFRDKLNINKKNCVFFVHGFNQSFKKNLEKSLALEKEHDIEVISFSWPSNPGGFKTKEYRHSKRTARASVGALDSTLEKMGRYLKVPFNRDKLKECDIKISLMAHSLGNYLFQNYVIDSIYEDETRIFDNVILCQADVDNKGHIDWVDTIEVGKRVYITINENDWVLKWSDANFQKDRLGRTVRALSSKNAVYFDFTNGPNVEKTHGLFYKKTNNVVKDFFTKVLNGERGERTNNLTFDAKTNTYRF